MTSAMIRRLLAVLVLLAALAGTAWHLSARNRGPTYLGRSVSYWEREARSWQGIYFGGFYSGGTIWLRQPTLWEKSLEKLRIPHKSDYLHCPLLEGDPSAVPVLAELLKSPDAGVRKLAAHGLMKIGGKAKTAIPALLAALEDENDDVRYDVEEALFTVDREAAERAGLKRNKWGVIQRDTALFRGTAPLPPTPALTHKGGG